MAALKQQVRLVFGLELHIFAKMILTCHLFHQLVFQNNAWHLNNNVQVCRPLQARFANYR